MQITYGDILELFKQQYPSDENTSIHSIEKDFPHNVREISKQIITTKLKSIRTNYRQSVDSGKRSTHGRVVWLYFVLWKSIWEGGGGRSTATTSIDNRVLRYF